MRIQDSRKALKGRELASPDPPTFTQCRVEFHPLHKLARTAMQRMADVFLRVEDQIEPLREYEATQDDRPGDGTERALGEARRAAAHQRGKKR